METTESATQVYRVDVKAPPEAVWDAITKPEWTRRYGFGGEVVYELHPGGAYRAPASAEMVAMGAPELMVTGEVLEADPPRRLVQTWHPVWDPEAAAEPATRLTWELRSDQGVTVLTLTHDLDGAPAAAAQVDPLSMSGGWSFVL
ncbi:MAG TPA: SRPBCC domain-containing protein, partial [Candidatus Elarobacter sp.]